MRLINYFHNLSINQKSLLVAALLHFGVFGVVVFDFRNEDSPVLSFSVTMMDNVTISQNEVSAAAVANVIESVRIEEIEEVKESDQKVFKKKPQKERKANKSDNITDAKQQNAVLGGDAPAVFNASYLNNPAPSYPVLSKKLGEQGRVLLNVLINEEGAATEVQIAQSSGFSRLDEAALNTVQNWKFVPAKKGGKFESSWVQVPISFILEKNKK